MHIERDIDAMRSAIVGVSRSGVSHTSMHHLSHPLLPLPTQPGPKLPSTQLSALAKAFEAAWRPSRDIPKLQLLLKNIGFPKMGTASGYHPTTRVFARYSADD